MSEAESKLAQDRGNRRAARGLFDTRLAQVKTDLAARGVGGRIKAKVQDDAVSAIKQGVDVARESKGIIAATAGALALWVFRAPLLGAARELFGQGTVQDDDDRAADDPEQENQA